MFFGGLDGFHGLFIGKDTLGNGLGDLGTLSRAEKFLLIFAAGDETGLYQHSRHGGIVKDSQTFAFDSTVTELDFLDELPLDVIGQQRVGGIILISASSGSGTGIGSGGLRPGRCCGKDFHSIGIRRGGVQMDTDKNIGMVLLGDLGTRFQIHSAVRSACHDDLDPFVLENGAHFLGDHQGDVLFQFAGILCAGLGTAVTGINGNDADGVFPGIGDGFQCSVDILSRDKDISAGHFNILAESKLDVIDRSVARSDVQDNRCGIIGQAQRFILLSPGGAHSVFLAPGDDILIAGGAVSCNFGLRLGC